MSKFEDYYVQKDEEITSRLLKYILATNYFYEIIDEVKDTVFYKHKLKQLVNSLEKELDSQQRLPIIRDFYKIADEEKYQNNLETHREFFKLLTQFPVKMLETFMVDFLENYFKTKSNG